jgi:NAD(P)-dependent dehydrogenase (short-subunit alcohol dehydrogenase family)
MNRYGGKVVLVTGAGQGIGRAVAQLFAGQGANVSVLDRDAARVAETVQALNGNGRKAVGSTGDISRRKDVTRAVQRTLEYFGRLDVLIANAGVTDVQPLLEIDDTRWRHVIDVNLTGTFFCIQEAARAMRERGGAIVVTASTNAFWVEATLGAYNASKAGVIALVRTAALDLAPFGIRVNAVEPGVVKTSFAAFVTEDPVAGPEYLKKIPLNRFAEPVDVANAILFLASPEADYITGQALVIDGGLTLGLPLAAAQFGSMKPVEKGPVEKSSRIKRKNTRTQSATSANLPPSRWP